MRSALCLCLLLGLGCSRGGLGPDGAADLAAGDGDDGGAGDDAAAPDQAAVDLRGAADLRAPADLSAPPDLYSGVLDVRIQAFDTCDITTTPASITVPSGTSFTVNWMNLASSKVNVDVAKIDMFNQVPIVLGLEPGNSYHDKVRAWCGTLFTGKFQFRITSCAAPRYIAVDCGGP